MKRLAHDVSRLLREGGHMVDVQIRTDECDFNVHADVLRMRSRGFEQMLLESKLRPSSAGLEGKGSLMEIEEDNHEQFQVLDMRQLPPEAVEWVLHFVYGDQKKDFPYTLLSVIRNMNSKLQVRGLASYLKKKFGLQMDQKHHHKTFFDLKKMEESHVRIVAGSRERQRVFSASAVILSVRGSFFKALFSRQWNRPEMKSARCIMILPEKRVLRFEDIDPDVMELLLHHAHAGEFPPRLVGGLQKSSAASLELWLAALHWGYYFGMDVACGEIEWLLARNHLSRQSLAKLWRCLPLVPVSGNRGLICDECIQYLEDNMSEFIEPVLRLDAELQTHKEAEVKGEVEERISILRKEANAFLNLPKDLIKAALVSGRIRVETQPLRKALRLWARFQMADRPEKKGFSPGESVMLSGLRSRPSLNGLQGVVRSSLQEGGRYVVQVLDGQSRRASLVRIRPVNLRRIDISRVRAIDEQLKELEPPATLFNNANRLRLEALSIIRRIQQH
eukprot:CAMPEP_0114487324 /NCGR_PEP_ID=MMETSP0109-20121206/704_1 /TAXON_ID=29199 /ORGANISM="Chlorarachnion reptans, Strain CCCM449" /LENGTH=503 /DNA_ID=CAMNT_0001663579 /DNA_START=45 /DNA_END=1556 /DNA_ORIENTATION=-